MEIVADGLQYARLQDEYNCSNVQVLQNILQQSFSVVGNTKKVLAKFCSAFSTIFQPPVYNV